VKCRTDQDAGLTLVEMLVVVALLATLTAVALPGLLTVVDDYRTASAARYLAGRFRLARMEAVRRSAAVAVRFQRDGASVRYASYVDGNHNGVRTADIIRGVDRALTGEEQIGDQFPGVRFELDGRIPVIGASTVTAADRDPVQVGVSGIVTFTPSGTSTSGTVYLKGRGEAQYAVRVLGATGRTRVLHYETGARAWIEQ